MFLSSAGRNGPFVLWLQGALNSTRYFHPSYSNVNGVFEGWKIRSKIVSAKSGHCSCQLTKIERNDQKKLQGPAHNKAPSDDQAKAQREPMDQEIRKTRFESHRSTKRRHRS